MQDQYLVVAAPDEEDRKKTTSSSWIGRRRRRGRDPGNLYLLQRERDAEGKETGAMPSTLRRVRQDGTGVVTEVVATARGGGGLDDFGLRMAMGEQVRGGVGERGHCQTSFSGNRKSHGEFQVCSREFLQLVTSQPILVSLGPHHRWRH